MDDIEKSGVRVIIDDLETPPSCPHGPTVLFDRQDHKFYACSACRNRKDCPFYVEHKTWIKKKNVKIFHNLPKINSYEYREGILKEVLSAPAAQRIFCHTCCAFFVESTKNIKRHKNHDTMKNVDDVYLKNPSKLFKPLENNKKEAQYLFSNESVKLIVDTLRKNKYKNILCIGTPRIHEYIQGKESDIKSLLLDIDDRHQIFYSPGKFVHYNMFNNHFFNGEDGKSILENFLQCESRSNTCLIMDPPFGGRIELLAQTLESISSMCIATLNVSKTCNHLLPVILIMPYFMEPQIKNYIPSLQMSDYQIAYENHSKFQDNQKNKTKTIVRMFTNIPLKNIRLPESQGYKFCKRCAKWVGAWNNHCVTCKSCTSKHGPTYVHCNSCEKCVKPSWSHCEKCKRCHLKDHGCVTLPNNEVCFNCQKPGHKQMNCPKYNKRKNVSDEMLLPLKRYKTRV